MAQNKSYNIKEISLLLDLSFRGDGSCEIIGIGTLENANTGQLSFLSNRSYKKQLITTKASAVIVEEKYADLCKTNALISESPYLSFAKATALFTQPQNSNKIIHPSAELHESAQISETASIGPNVVIEENVSIGANSIIGANSYIGNGVIIGEGCRFHNNVSIYQNVKIGHNVLLHSGVVIGADGFGFAFDGEKSIKIHQLGSVEIGDHVEVGACSTIDRGAIDNTIIGEGVKIDNQVQIGHNCRIGDHSIICGCVGIAGSVTIGKNCIMGGASGAVGHITISDQVQVSAMSLVSESILEPGVYSSGTWHMKTSEWKRNNIRFRQLDSIYKRIVKLEKIKRENKNMGDL